MPIVADVTRLGTSPRAVEILDRRNYAIIASFTGNGLVHQAVVWVIRDQDALLFSSVQGRVTVKNLERDPRASVLVYDIAEPEEYVSARGLVEILPDPLRDFSNRVSRKYTGRDHVELDPSAVRVVLRFTPDRAILRRL